MKFNTGLILFFIFCFTELAVAQEVEAQELLHQLIAENHTVGVSAAYMSGDTIRWSSASGYADRDTKRPFKAETISRIASIAKPMTAVAVMQLVEQGRVDLNATIQTYVPEFPKKKKGTITVKQVLSHSSGIPAYKNTREAQTKVQYTSLQDAMNVFKDRKLDFKPGTDYGYTTYGYVVLGVLIENVSGLTYEQYLQEYIWKKAGMQNTGIVQYLNPRDGQSALYHKDKKGNIVARPENNLSNRIPGGGFYSTTGDLMKFAAAIINNKLITEKTLELMLRDNGLKKHGNPYGFGFLMYTPKPNISALIGHGGEQTGVSAQLMIMPKRKMASVVLANTSRSYKEVIALSAKLINVFNPR